jgi:hypothetical protein
MITNWYPNNIDPNFLSRRLRIAYTMWLWETVNCEDRPPSLDQLNACRLFSDIEPFMAVAEGPTGNKFSTFTYAYVGAGVEEVYGQKLYAQPMNTILTVAGRALVEESYAALRKGRRPVHFGISGSPVLSTEIEVIVMPLRHLKDNMELAALVYQYDDQKCDDTKQVERA